MSKGKRVLKRQKKQPNNDLLNAYFTSLVSVMLCCVMLLGSTFAWFHTSETSAGNEINSGILKIDMVHLSSNGEVSLAEHPEHAVFSTSSKWTPGRTQIETIQVRNVGSVALVYKLDFVPDTKRSTQLGASDLFSVYVKDGAVAARERGVEYGDELNSMGWAELGALSEVMDIEEGQYLYEGENLLKPGEEKTISIALYMAQDVSSAVMGAQIPLYLKLEAVQPVAEEEK